MKRNRSISILMTALIIGLSCGQPIVKAIEPNSINKEQDFIEEKSQSVNFREKEMKERIQKNLLQSIFFRPDLIKGINNFFSEPVHFEDILEIYRTPSFLSYLEKNDINVSYEDSVQKVVTDKNERKIKRIIEADDVELLKKEVEKRNCVNVMIEDFFLEKKGMRIPILHYCTMKKAIKCFKFLILNGVDPLLKITTVFPFGEHPYAWDCMSVAICFGEWEMMKILEERGIQKFDNPSVWEAAALTHRNQILGLFISKKGEIEKFDECLKKGMEGAAKGNNLKGMKLLLSAGASINIKDNDGNTLMHIAARYDSVEIGRLLISKVSSINNSRNKQGKTPMDLAAWNNSVQMGELLISKGDGVNAIDIARRTPLHIAACNDFVKMGKLLIRKGADINVVDVAQRTPLHVAAWNNSVGMGELLISKGASVNVRNVFGDTPLHSAVQNNSMKMGELLIEKGADVNARNFEWKTPMCYVKKKEMQQLLLSNNAHE